jgi:hypothetical protein
MVGVCASGYKFIVDNDNCAFGESEPAHPIVEMLAACYAAAAAVHRAVGAADIPLRLPVTCNVLELVGGDEGVLTEPVSIGRTYLAGAGAIGNGVLLGFSGLAVHGELHVCDPDTVSEGNLNRCVWFTRADIGSFKADRLARNAQPLLPSVQVVPHKCTLQKVGKPEGGAWLERLIVAVDSRRARRTLQNELPHHVFDASTTGIEEVVLHFNQSPTERACLSCIYWETQEESAHERHVADSLGVTPEDVRSGLITEAAACAIVLRYSNLSSEHLVGLAYDSLFKQLCGQGALKTAADKQVLAPFAFVSVLAGVLLAIECARRMRSNATEVPFNYWRVSPWASPLERTREMRGKRNGCEFCYNTVIKDVVRSLWRQEVP